VLAVALLVVAVGLGTAAALTAGRDDAPAGPAAPSWATADVDDYATQLLAAADAARTGTGAPGWEPAPCARAAAAERAAALVGADLEHAPLGPVLAACAPLTAAAENLSRAAAPPLDVVEAWMGSAGHRANIEDPALTQAGAACVQDAGEVLCSLVLVGP
jgi:hypothetical protein